ncbi:MAG TPA: GNAT family N-acetyltransferase [Candidatus Rifleibacterium sp.]|nr:GNAT family N-acetyltransferase [Candidatus Rifleibacterium sp.]HPT48340.1 GNAT family N-acetyltransferase [Candidatus Rifleibacterium sp.]
MSVEIKFFRGLQPLFVEAMLIRTIVFVDEQNVPVELERDEYDQSAEHLLLLLDDKVVATGRIFHDQLAPGLMRLGRVAVLKDHRSSGLGRQVVLALLKRAEADPTCERVAIHAQKQLIAWYAGLGFVPCGEEFMEAGIRHQEMFFQVR